MLRTQRGLTQEQLAHALDIPETSVRRWESTGKPPRRERLVKMADFFGVSIDFLLGRDDRTDDTDDPKPNSQFNIPSWATRKDVRDFKKMLEEDAPVMFDGVPLDDEDREKVLKVMEAIFWDAKKRNKRKPVEE